MGRGDTETRRHGDSEKENAGSWSSPIPAFRFHNLELLVRFVSPSPCLRVSVSPRSSCLLPTASRLAHKLLIELLIQQLEGVGMRQSQLLIATLKVDEREVVESLCSLRMQASGFFV